MKSKIRVFKKSRNYLRVLTDKGRDRNKGFFVHYSRVHDKKRRSLFVRLDGKELRLSGTQARAIWRVIGKAYTNGGGRSHDSVNGCLINMVYRPKRRSSLLLSATSTTDNTASLDQVILNGRQTRTVWNVLNKVYG